MLVNHKLDFKKLHRYTLGQLRSINKFLVFEKPLNEQNGLWLFWFKFSQIYKNNVGSPGSQG